MPKLEGNLRSKLAALGAGILVVVAGFVVYNYFSKVEEEEVSPEVEQELEVGGEEEEEGFEEVLGEEEVETEEEKEAEEEEKEEEVVGTWKANDYKEGDITGDNYTVKRGDTLWEIAEGRYGDGFSWTKIRDANQADIGFLPNGQQSLIVPGQVLTLP